MPSPMLISLVSPALFRITVISMNFDVHFICAIFYGAFTVSRY